ncbi:MAG: hypothetical protein ACPG43_12535, partial [Alcanivoracaceae bacterium]
MIELVRFREQLPALFLQQVLEEQGIRCVMREDAGVFCLLLADPEDFQRARQLTDEVAASPYDARFQAAARRAAQREALEAQDKGAVYDLVEP